MINYMVLKQVRQHDKKLLEAKAKFDYFEILIIDDISYVPYRGN